MRFYSDKLDKIFDTEKDLEDAEKKLAEEEAKKAEAKALVKKEADKVNDAYAARNAARKTYNEKLVELRKSYNDAVRKANDEFQASLKEITAVKDATEDAFNKELKEFQGKHPEGFRISLKDDYGNTATYESESDVFCDLNSQLNKSLDWFDRFCDLLRF